jgi:hypothetical protein
MGTAGHVPPKSHVAPDTLEKAKNGVSPGYECRARRVVAQVRHTSSGIPLRQIHCRSDCGSHRGAGGGAAGDGVCHCFGCAAAGRNLLRDRHRLLDFGAGRLQDANRRAHGRIRGCGVGNHYAVRHRWAVYVHHAGGCAVGTDGSDGAGCSGEVFPATGDRGVHERDCGPDREHADTRFLWHSHGVCSGRFLSPHGSAGGEFLHAEPGGIDRGHCIAGGNAHLR